MDILAKHRRIGNLILELNNLYNQALGLCRGIDNLPDYYRQKHAYNYTPIKFSDQMNAIRIYLKIIAGEYTDDDYEDLLEMWFSIDMDWTNMEELTSHIIEWLRNVIKQCENTLKIQYQPGGSIFQQLQQKNIGRCGMGV